MLALCLCVAVVSLADVEGAEGQSLPVVINTWAFTNATQSGL